MGFRFRKSASFGPLRINFSKSGVGYSVGGKGFRVTKKAGGGVRTTASIPGTGISYVTDHGSKKKSASSQGSGTCSNANSGTSGKKPFYQRPWFVAVVIIVLLSTMGSACSGDDTDLPDDATSQQEETALSAEDDTTQEEQTTQPSETDTSETPEDAEETSAENSMESPETAPPKDSATPDSAVKEQNTSNESNAQQETTSTAAPATPSTSTPVSQPVAQPDSETEPQTSSQEGAYVGSIDSDKYHDPGCRWAKKILPENEIWFESKEAAQAAGYLPCGTCQ